MRKLVGILACLLLVSGAQAAVIYQYQGNNFNEIFDNDPPAGSYTTEMSVSVELVFDERLEPNESLNDIGFLVSGFRFTDGRNVLTDANSRIWEGNVQTGGDGEIVGWSLLAARPPESPGFVGNQEFVIATRDASTIIGGDGGRISECTAIDDSLCTSFSDDFARLNFVGDPNLAGTWTIIPIPAAAWLFGSALGLLGICRRLTRWPS